MTDECRGMTRAERVISAVLGVASRAAIRAGKVDTSAVTDSVRARLIDNPIFQFGLTDFLVTTDGREFVALLRAAVKDDGDEYYFQSPVVLKLEDLSKLQEEVESVLVSTLQQAFDTLLGFVLDPTSAPKDE